MWCVQSNEPTLPTRLILERKQEPTLIPSPQSIAEKLQQHVQVVEQRVSVQEAIHALEMLELFELQKPDDEFDKENLYFLTKRRRELEDVLWEKAKRRRRNASVCKLE